MTAFIDERLHDVWINKLFPLLDHNDLLRLRRVCNWTKEIATGYMFTLSYSKPWKLEISQARGFGDILDNDLPPPSEIYVSRQIEEQSVFETDRLDEFLETYGEHITHLTLENIWIPFTGTKEMQFYSGLTNLKSLTINDLHTGRSVEFEKRKGINTSGFVLPRFRNLKVLRVDFADDLNLTWQFINQIGNELEMLSTPYSRYFDDYLLTLDHLPREFLDHQGSIKYLDCQKTMFFMDVLECHRLFDCCFRHNIKMKNVPAHALKSVLVDVNVGRVDSDQVYDPVLKEYVYTVDYQRNGFIGSLILSLKNWSPFVFLMDMPNLEEIETMSFFSRSVRFWRRHPCRPWPNLKKLKLIMDSEEDTVDRFMQFLWQQERPNLEDIAIIFKTKRAITLLNPVEIGTSFCNLKKLAIENYGGHNNFFVILWERLMLLENVRLRACYKMGNNGFIGNVKGGKCPSFMNLKRLKHLSILDIGDMKINDNLFNLVIRNIRLVSLELSSRGRLSGRITTNGIKSLLTGIFAESIEYLNLKQLKLRGTSADEMEELQKLFRSSNMF